MTQAEKEEFEEEVLATWDAMTQEMREIAFQVLNSNFCTACWSDDPTCQCANDE